MSDRDAFLQHLKYTVRMAEMAVLFVGLLPEGLPGVLSFNPLSHLLSCCHIGVQVERLNEARPWLDALGRLGAQDAGRIVDGLWIRLRFILPSFRSLEVYLLYPVPGVGHEASPDKPFTTGDPFAAFIETLDL